MRPLDANELEALKLFANGKSAEEIAAEMNVSRSMAQHYVRVAAAKPGVALESIDAAARKLRARNRVHAVALAVRMGLFDVTGGGN